MQTLGKILAGICAALFVTTGVLALFLFNVERKAFSAQTYKLAFERQQLYDKMPSVLATALTNSIARNQNADPFLKAVTQQDWEKTVTLLIPPEELKTLTDTTLDTVFDYLNGKTDSVEISLVPLKKHFVGEAGVQAVTQLLSAQPPCTAEQLFQLGMGLLSGDVGLCNPPVELMGVMTPLIESQIQGMTVAIPDNVTLVDRTLTNAPNDPRIQLNKVRGVMKVTLIFPLLFLFGLALLTARSLSSWLKWWGVPFIITGAISALIALLGSPVLSLLMQRVLQNRAPDFLQPVFLSTMQEAVGAVSQQILAPIVVEGLLLVVAGIVMILIVVYLAHREKAFAVTK